MKWFIIAFLLSICGLLGVYTILNWKRLQKKIKALVSIVLLMLGFGVSVVIVIMPVIPDTGAIDTFTVANSLDDCSEDIANEKFENDSTALKIYTGSSTKYYHAGVLFQASIAQGSTINSANLSLWAYTTVADDAYMDIYGHAVANSPCFSDSSQLLSARSQTTATVEWVESGMAAVEDLWVNKSITSIVQELVNNASWVSGNNMTVMMLTKQSADTLRLYTYSWDRDVHQYAPKLYVDYNPVPQASDVGWNSTVIGQSCNFSCNWTGSTLDWCGFTWNATGSWSSNETVWNNKGGNQAWANITKTLPDTVDDVVSLKFYANDSIGMGDSGIYSLTLTYPDYGEWQKLEVSSSTFDENDSNWNSTGTSPWLNATDYPTNYINTSIAAAEAGNWSFQVPSNLEYKWVSNVTVGLNYSRVNALHKPRLYYLYNNEWTSIDCSPPETSGWMEENITLPKSFMEDDFENLRIKFALIQSGTGDLKIDYACLYVKTWTLIGRIQWYLESIGVINWTERYFSSIFSKQTKADYEQHIDNLASEEDWKNVLIWSARYKKFGVEQEQSIKYALGNHSQVGDLNPLPYSGVSGKNYFSVYDRDLLYSCYYYAEEYSYLKDKWNLTEAYNYFNTTLHSESDGNYSVLWIYNDTTTYSLSNKRFYDEQAESISCYLIFHELNVTTALDNALEIWGQINNNHWSDTWQNFKYTKSVSEVASFECEGSSFLKIIALLRYFKDDMGNYTRLTVDTYSRYLQKNWTSPQWCDSDNKTAYVVRHKYVSNDERRLGNTVAAWFTMFGVYSMLNSTAQTNMQEILKYGWQGVYHAFAGLYDDDTGRFRSITGGSTSADHTLTSLTMQFLLGMIPVTTTIAFPLEELHYEYIYDIDPDFFALNFTSRKVKLGVQKSGTIRFIYGGVAVDKNFSEDGIYELTFNSTWTGITDCARAGDLPSDRKYFVTYDKLSVGWNDNQVFLVDVDKTLAQVNASLNTDSINWTVIIIDYQNGTMWELIWDQTEDEYYGWADKIVNSSSDIIAIYCLEAGNWYHEYS